jgi:hypothetical protein
MIAVRSLRSVCLNVVLGVGVALPSAGCGSGAGETQAQVSADFQKKTSNMLEQLSKDQMEKHKKKAPHGR